MVMRLGQPNEPCCCIMLLRPLKDDVPPGTIMIDLAPNNPYGLALASPVLTAAGCFGYGVEYARLVDVERIGAIVTRSTTLYRRRVARPPRLVETPAGVLAVGPWPNPGLSRVIEPY